jgi:hypothetical protein
MFATRFLAVSIAVLSNAGPNNATASTVHDLITYCSSSIDSSDYSYCIGVMVGAEDLAKVAAFNELREQSQQDTFPLPNDPQTGKPFTDPRLAIIAIDQDIMRLARFSSGQGGEVAREKITALRDWRDRIGDSIKPSGVSSKAPALDICFGNSSPAPIDLADAFITWAKAHPAANDWDEAIGLMSVFREKWPCRSSNHRSGWRPGRRCYRSPRTQRFTPQRPKERASGYAPPPRRRQPKQPDTR